MGILQLFVAASVPVIKVLLVTGVGAMLATKNINILCEDARKHMNKIVFYVFNPALVSSNLSKTVTFESLALLWFMPVNIFLTFVVGSALGWIIIKLTEPPANMRGLVLGCSATGNLGNMLLIIIPAICTESVSPFGAPDVCYTYGLAYASLSMAIGAVFMWSYVYNMIRISASSEEDEKLCIEDGNEKASITEEKNKLLVTNGKVITDNCEVSCKQVDELSVTVNEGCATTSKVEKSVKLRSIFSTISRFVDIKKLFTPSIIGVIVGFTVGSVPVIRKALIGETAPFRVIQESAALTGQGAIPTVTLIMGGNLIRGFKGSSVRFSIILGIISVRYIFSPLLGMLLLKCAIRLGLVHSDPLFQFVLYIQYALPPAMNISTMTQLFGAGESECSVIFLWAYSLASVFLTLWSAFFMWLVSTN